MLLSFEPTVRDRLVTLLAKRGPLLAFEIAKQLKPQVTIQAIYQELRNLMRMGVVLKVSQKYMLKLSWVSDLQMLSTEMTSANYAKSAVELVEHQKRQRWVLHGLLPTLNLWAQLTQLLLPRCPKRQLLEFAPHAWFHLVQAEVENQFGRMMKHMRASYFLIVGDDTFLDRSYAPFFKAVGSEIGFAESPFSALRQEYFSVIGDYVIKVEVPLPYANSLDELFQKVQRLEVEQVSKINSILHRKVKVRMTLELNKSKTARISKQFRDYFGKV